MGQHIGIEGSPVEDAHYHNVGGTGSEGFVPALSRTHAMDSDKDACVRD
jgi:hypothetical protein